MTVTLLALVRVFLFETMLWFDKPAKFRVGATQTTLFTRMSMLSATAKQDSVEPRTRNSALSVLSVPTVLSFGLTYVVRADAASLT
jgi:hypothetical protein